MIVKILGNIDTPAYKAAEDCVRKKGHRVWRSGASDLVIAPPVSYTHLRAHETIG